MLFEAIKKMRSVWIFGSDQLKSGASITFLKIICINDGKHLTDSTFHLVPHSVTLDFSNDSLKTIFRYIFKNSSGFKKKKKENEFKIILITCFEKIYIC